MNSASTARRTAARRSAATAAFAFTQGQASCGDCHDVWIDPKDPKRYITVTTAARIDQHAERPQSIRIPNGQMYHVHVDNRVPYWIYSNRQDDGTMRGPSDELGDDRQRLSP